MAALHHACLRMTAGKAGCRMRKRDQPASGNCCAAFRGCNAHDPSPAYNTNSETSRALLAAQEIQPCYGPDIQLQSRRLQHSWQTKTSAGTLRRNKHQGVRTMLNKVMSVIAAILLAMSGARAAAADAELAGAAAPAAGDPVGIARYAWLLFAHAVKPTNGSLAFETWTEQCQLNPAMAGCPSPAALAKGRVLHGSALARKMRQLRAPHAAAATDTGIECNPMTTTPLGNYPPPANVTEHAQFCEEVYVNAPEVSFVKTNKLQTLTGQQKYGSATAGGITFPADAIEVKADWVPTTSFTNPTFKCPDPNNSLYTETINGTCYALVGLHISSKILPDWLWATFEPASKITNPNRCDPQLYDACFDPWGTTSATPYGKGKTVPPSAQLTQLMASAGLNKAFANYYLTAAQTQFVTAAGKPVPLGNSFVEFNAGVPPKQASCITCHKYAYFDGKPVSPENNFGGPPTGWAPIGYACNNGQTGNCTPVVPSSISQDFSWMLGLMPVN